MSKAGNSIVLSGSSEGLMMTTAEEEEELEGAAMVNLTIAEMSVGMRRWIRMMIKMF